MKELRSWVRRGLGLSALGVLIASGAACGGTVTSGSGAAGDAGTAGTAGAGGGGAAGAGGTAGTGGVACQPEKEICDGKDNDCDGQVDNVPGLPEACMCFDGATQECYTGADGTADVGECKKGSQTCQNGAWGACEGEVTPANETCNSKDDDCNGKADDLPQITCGVGQCQVTVDACANGAPNQCVPGQPGIEVCDGKDNNCNQLVDETDPNVDKDCMTGGQGVCAAGKNKCMGGVLTCVGQSPGMETCDGLDNDCDGIVDNAPGTGGMCSTGANGVCAAGVISCQNVAGSWTIDCFSVVPSSPEICDGLDNDCDGTVDDGDPGGGGACDTGNPGACGPGVLHCTSGAIQCVANAAAQPETCNNMDDNCDGQIDEGNPGGGVACSTGVPGICATGTTSCTNGMVVCNQTVQAQPEMCNGLDDNCNGVIDDGNPGGGAACSTGLLGVCAAGTITCQNAQLVCVQNVQASPEICGNAIDENCDGLAPAAPTVYFNEPFANNNAGWTLGTEWAIGPAIASNCGSLGQDPGTDHTPTADNGLAGDIIGGCYGTTLHADYCLTSPNINVSGAPGNVYLSYWRHLHSDYPSFITNHVDVSANGGSSWTTVFTSPAGQFIQDTAWTQQSFNVTAQKSATFRVRFCYSAGSSGIITGAGWSVDDVQLTDTLCN